MTDKPAAPEWKQLELLVAEIQKQLAPGATVTHNAKLHGMQSETTRQIDVLVEQSVGQYPLRIVLDCKDTAAPVDVKGVEEFDGLVKDVGAHKGAMVCPKGFTASARKRARKLQIDIYSPADTDPHKWQVRLALPVVIDFRATAIAFGLRSSTPHPLIVRDAIWELPAFSEADQPLGTFYDIAVKRWNDGEYPHEPGEHEDIPLLPSKVKIDNGHGMLIPVELYVSLHVTSQRYFGFLPIDQCRGLKDEQTGLVITNAFKFRLVNPARVQSQWQKLSATEEPPRPVMMTVIGLHSWGPKADLRPPKRGPES